MKKFLILFLLFLYSVFPQNHQKRTLQGFIPRVFTDIIYIPGDTTVTVYLTYRIPYSTLVFEKKDDVFSSAYRIDAEIFDEENEFVDRQINDEEVTSGLFENTNSETIFDQGFLEFNLKPGSYNMITQFTDLNSRKEMPPRNVELKADISANFYQPLVVTRTKNCSGSDYKLVNFEGNIPFDGNNYELLIPVRNSAQEYKIEISNNGSVFYSANVKKEKSGTAVLNICEGEIVMNFNGQSGLSYLNISTGVKILEGDLTITLQNEKNEAIQVFRTNVRWYNKPRTLKNRELAVKLLKYIDEEEEYKYISSSSEKFDSVFFDYWKQYDPTPENSYNELMHEYYSRADYAALNFSSLNGRTGLDSDRGKIYIKFGKPSKIERISNEKGKMIEIWVYSNQKKFSFIDEKGTGEFNLLNG